MYHDINKVALSGYLTKNPEAKDFNGSKTCQLNIECLNEFYNNRSKSTGKEICYIDAQLWGSNAEIAQQAEQGDYVAVEGKLKLNSWVDNNGQKHTRYVINADKFINLSKNMRPYKPVSQNNAPDSSHMQSTPTKRQSSDTQPFDEDLPF